MPTGLADGLKLEESAFTTVACGLHVLCGARPGERLVPPLAGQWAQSLGKKRCTAEREGMQDVLREDIDRRARGASMQKGTAMVR